jgi:hypothetical protein
MLCDTQRTFRLLVDRAGGIDKALELCEGYQEQATDPLVVQYWQLIANVGKEYKCKSTKT